MKDFCCFVVAACTIYFISLVNGAGIQVRARRQQGGYFADDSECRGGEVLNHPVPPWLQA
jgi:hypothetical protein